MPRAATRPSASPPNWLERSRGKRLFNIDLPRPVDARRDPRLPPAGLLETVRENVGRARQTTSRVTGGRSARAKKRASR